MISIGAAIARTQTKAANMLFMLERLPDAEVKCPPGFQHATDLPSIEFESHIEANRDRILRAKKLMSSHPNPHIIVGAQQATLAGNSGGLRFR